MKERRKRRSAKDIKESIINAATHLIETEGFSNLTVTGIMRQAEIEPVQFYNRYDDLNRFIDEYVKKYDYWFSDIVKSQKQSSNDKELYINILIGLFQSLSGNKVMQELLKWELVATMKLVNVLPNYENCIHYLYAKNSQTYSPIQILTL